MEIPNDLEGDLQETESPIIGNTISYSAVQTYQQCPLKYKLSYIDRIETEYTTDSLFLGSTIHSALEACMLKFKDTGRLMSCVELHRTYTDIFGEKIRHKKIRYHEGWNAQRLERMGRNMLSCWLSKFIGYSRSVEEVIAVEQRFEIQAHDPESGFQLSRTITGVIDLILKLQSWPKSCYIETPFGIREFKNYSYLILDHKTAVQKFPDMKINRDLQLTLYQFASLKLGLIPDREKAIVGFSVLLKKQTPEFQLYTSRRTELQERQMLKTFSHVTDAIDLQLFYPSYNTITCKNCPYLERECRDWLKSQ